MRFFLSLLVFATLSILAIVYTVNAYENGDLVAKPYDIANSVVGHFVPLVDGVYTGTADYVTVEVTIKDNLVTDIEILTNRQGSYAEAAERVIDRVIKKQSVMVDTITGATGTSRVILNAISDAIMKVSALSESPESPVQNTGQVSESATPEASPAQSGPYDIVSEASEWSYTPEINLDSTPSTSEELPTTDVDTGASEPWW